MDIFGIGPLEFLFVLILILLVAGPKDIGKGARALGRGLNRLYRSANYQMVRRVSQEIRNLPARLAEEAQLEELKEVAQLKELKEAEAEVKAAARDISVVNKQEMEAWVTDLDAPGAGQPRKPAGTNANAAGTPGNSIGGKPPAMPATTTATGTSVAPPNITGGQPPRAPATVVSATPPATQPAGPVEQANGQEPAE
jgi:sec-independent protein translocase protein TatB